MARRAGSSTVAPAERLARLGVPVSRALSRDLQAGAVALGADARRAASSARARGTAVTEGDNWAQTDLAGDAGRPSASAAASISSRGAWRACCRTRSRNGRQHAARDRCATPCRRPARRPARAMAASGSMSRPRRWPARARWPAGTASPAPAARRADQLRRHLRLRGDRREGRCGGVQPVDGPALRRAHHRARHRHPARRADRRRTAVSPLVIGNPGNGEVLFAGAGGGSPYAAYATGVIARGTVRAPSSTVQRRSRPMAGGAATSMPSPVPTASAAAARPARAASIRPARAWRCSLTRADGGPDVASRIAPRRRGRSVHRHGRDGRRRREGGGGRHRHPSRGRPAQHAGAQGGAGGRARRARQRSHRLRRGARHSRAARAHRAALSRHLRRRVSRPSA